MQKQSALPRDCWDSAGGSCLSPPGAGGFRGSVRSLSPQQCSPQRMQGGIQR
ncbi:hypothetical protein HGM15179_000646, partial [Zosterops borbonicus]